jgi:hypothetical protein
MAGGTVLRYFDDPRIFEGRGPRSKAIADFIESNHRDLFFLKSDDFETEHEYRAVEMLGKVGESAYDNQAVTIKGDYVCVDYGDALAVVIVGERFPAAVGCEALDRTKGRAVRQDRPAGRKAMGVPTGRRARDDPSTHCP